MKKRWIILMAILVVISVMGLFAPEQPELWTVDSNVNNADVAWMITATIFVLMMTPGLSLFYGGMVRQKNVILQGAPP
jgi:Amt family ammonium transporter